MRGALLAPRDVFSVLSDVDGLGGGTAEQETFYPAGTLVAHPGGVDRYRWRALRAHRQAPRIAPDTPFDDPEEVNAFQLAQPGFIRDGTWGGSVRRIESEEPSTRRKIGARAGPMWHYAALRGTTWHKMHPYM